jgi:plastocyanin
VRRLLALGLVAALAACSSSAPSTQAVATDHVNLPRSYRFDPPAITVPDGTTVTWTNNDQFTHSVRLLDDGGAVMVMKRGESVTHTFTGVGLHHYDCSFHSQNMQGSVLVTAASAS